MLFDADAFNIILVDKNEVFTVRLALAALVQVPVPLLRRIVPIITLPLLDSVAVAR